MSWPKQRPEVCLALVLLTIAWGTNSLGADDQQMEYVIGYMGVGTQSAGIAHVLGFINPDGTDERYPEFGRPDQKSWVFGPQFADGLLHA